MEVGNHKKDLDNLHLHQHSHFARHLISLLSRYNQETSKEKSARAAEVNKKVNVCDAEDNESEQSTPHESLNTVETNISSSASSPSSALKSAESQEEERGQPSSDQMADDASRISWESGTIPMTASPRVTVKLLVSNNMAGSIIGRSGQTVNELQTKSSAKIRLSQSGDYFPGTTDRVCLVHGSLVNVKKAVALVLSKLYELQLELLVDTPGDHTQDNSENAQESSENPFKINFTSKILIPSAACGMLIGKEGATIQKLKEKVGCSAVRLSQKLVDHNAPRTFERVLTVSSFEVNECILFAESILDGFVRHPEICRYLNGTTSYSKNATAPSYGITRNNPIVPTYTSAPTPLSNVARQPYAHSGSIHEMEPLGQGAGFDVQGGNVRQTQYSNSPQSAINAPGSIISPSAPFLSSHQMSSPPPASFNSTINLAVPDSMIGALLGRRGQTLMDLQSESGARIRVSQRDEFVPGTSNRIVTLSGAQDSVNNARNMIRQLLSRNP